MVSARLGWEQWEYTQPPWKALPALLPSRHKRGVFGNYPLQGCQKKNEPRMKCFFCCILYMKCPVHFHLLCKFQKCCGSLRGKNKIVQNFRTSWIGCCQDNIWASANHLLHTCQMDNSYFSLRHRVWIFQRSATGIFFSPSLFLNHHYFLLAPYSSFQVRLCVRRLQPSLRFLSTIRRKHYGDLFWMQMPDTVWAYMTSTQDPHRNAQ